MNKGVIILGSAASGKTTLIKELNIPNFYNTNPDKFVENKEHEFYNNPLQASNWVYNKLLPQLILNNDDFILDTTGANTKTLRKIINNKQYQFKAVMVYCNPIIVFIRNFSGERKLPKQVLLENWLKVYSHIEEYKNIFGEGNIYIYETEYTNKELTIIGKYMGLSQYLNENKGDYTSSFKKEDTKYTPIQSIEKTKKFTEILYKVDNLGFDMIYENNYLTPIGVSKEYIKEELEKWIA